MTVSKSFESLSPLLANSSYSVLAGSGRRLAISSQAARLPPRPVASDFKLFRLPGPAAGGPDTPPSDSEAAAAKAPALRVTETG